MRYDFNYLRSGLDFILKHSSLAHIKPKRVLVPAFICPIIPEVIRQNGFEVEFADADLGSFNMKISDADLDEIGAVFVCHTFGAKCEIPSGAKTDKEPLLIEDCAHFLSKEREGDFALYSMYKQVPNVRGGYVECEEDLSDAYDHLFTDCVGIGDLPAFLLKKKGPHQPFFNFLRSVKGLPVCDSVTDEEWDVLKASPFTKKTFACRRFDPAKNIEIYNEMKHGFEILGLGKFCEMQQMPEGSVPFNFSIRVGAGRDEILLKLRRKKVFADRMWYNANTAGCKNAEILARNIINLPLGLKSLVELKNAIS